MRVPLVKLDILSEKAANRIKKASLEKPASIGEQMVMTNYYGFLHANANNSLKDYAKIMCGK